MYRTIIAFFFSFSAEGTFIAAPFSSVGKLSFQRIMSSPGIWSSSTEEDDDDASLIEPWMENGDTLLHIHEPPEFERAVLNQKLHSLQLSDQKLLVLQDAAQRMVRRHEAELRDTRAQHATAMVAKENTAKLRHETEMERVRQTLERRVQKIEADHKAERLRLKENYQKQLEEELLEHTARIESLQDAHALDRFAWSKQESQLRSALAASEKASMHQLRHANCTMQAMQVEMQEERDRFGLLKHEYKTVTERYERLKSRWNHLREQNEALVAQQQTMEKKAQEQMEIATSAVAAATQREQALQEKYDALLLQYNGAIQQSRQELSAPQRNLPPDVQSAIADRASDNALSHRVRGILDLVLNARAVRFVRRWFRYIFIPRAPSSFRKRNSSAVSDS
jgi:hypothetical protein